jgi:hypothetical protein
MLGHDALCLWTMPPVPWHERAATCVTSSWWASRNINAKFPYTLWGAWAVPSISDGYIGINRSRREDTVIVLTPLNRLDVRPLTHILPLDVQLEWTLSAQLPPQQIFILSFLRKGVLHLTSYDIMLYICNRSTNRKWETCWSKKTMRNSPQAICNPHIECYELSTAWEIREIPIGILKASFPESIWSSNMEITNKNLP